MKDVRPNLLLLGSPEADDATGCVQGHSFPKEVILFAVRWYCRCPLWYRDVRDPLAERDVEVDAATIFRWVQKFGPEIAKRAFLHRNWRGRSWHVDETFLRVHGRWSRHRALEPMAHDGKSLARARPRRI